jgi:hypothetical protein
VPTAAPTSKELNMTDQTDRRFLVARTGPSIVIREVPAGSSSSEYDRDNAWLYAALLARPARRSTSWKAVRFQPIAGDAVLIPADKVRAAAEGHTLAEVQVIRSQPVQHSHPNPVHTIDTPLEQPARRTAKPASPAQLSFLNSLIQERVLPQSSAAVQGGRKAPFFV